MIIAVDFDGTIVKHEYPNIGDPVPHAIDTLLFLQSEGHELVLWTVRSTDKLRDALDYCNSKGIIFVGVNEHPTQKFWSGSPKVYAKIYIDDADIGCPLLQNDTGRKKPYVNWLKIRELIGI